MITWVGIGVVLGAVVGGTVMYLVAKWVLGL